MRTEVCNQTHHAIYIFPFHVDYNSDHYLTLIKCMRVISISWYDHLASRTSLMHLRCACMIAGYSSGHHRCGCWANSRGTQGWLPDKDKQKQREYHLHRWLGWPRCINHSPSYSRASWGLSSKAWTSSGRIAFWGDHPHRLHKVEEQESNAEVDRRTAGPSCFRDGGVGQARRGGWLQWGWPGLPCWDTTSYHRNLPKITEQ